MKVVLGRVGSRRVVYPSPSVGAKDVVDIVVNRWYSINEKIGMMLNRDGDDQPNLGE